MNCAKKLYEYMRQNGEKDPQKRIAVVTAGVGLGASRMSGSDKQTYYKMGTSPDVADSAEEFAKNLTAAGCCHADLAMAEAIGSLRGFYNLVEAGVPFPHDPMGVYVGYKTDHDPYERATSAGPKTSRYMSECLERIVRGYGIEMFDRKEVVELLTVGEYPDKRIVGVVTADRGELDGDIPGIHVFYARTFVLAAGGPGAMYQTSVYPLGQTGIHGVALKAGLDAENLTESQFGLASTKFRWNVSGTYMQAIPRIFSTNADGTEEREFLADIFPAMSRMATCIFLKGYQWPFDPQRIEKFQSSLIDVLVFQENQKSRRVFMDFQRNPIGNPDMSAFCLDDLEPEALHYLQATGAMQSLPIERLAHMNSPAIEIYQENGIDLYSEPLEISVCAQHCNGGFAVDRWWQSSIPGTFVIGEMAGTHGVKRPGGSALNAGQVGAQRAAEYIAQMYGGQIADEQRAILSEEQLSATLTRLQSMNSKNVRKPEDVMEQIQHRMTAFGGHVRELHSAEQALHEAVDLVHRLENEGFCIQSPNDWISAIQAEHLALMSVATLKSIVELLRAGSGSRGSHLVLSEDGQEIHPQIKNPANGRPLRCKPENNTLRNQILRIGYAPDQPDLMWHSFVPPRNSPKDRKAFEVTWADFRRHKVYY